MLLVIQELESLRTRRSRQTRNDGDFPDAPDAAFAASHVTALDEVLVFMGVLEAPNERPNDIGWGVDTLRYQRRACVGCRLEFMVLFNERLQPRILF
ncbi:hypothetical protein V6N13_144929 [Hibiscus sabdariffa]